MNYLTFLPIWEKWMPGVMFRVQNTSKAVFLTFDDGPNAETTPRILDILAQFNAQASFFVRGDALSAAPGLLLQLHRLVHTIGNHSFSHVRLWRKKRTEIIREVEETSRMIEQILGSPPRFFRPPYGKLRPGMTKLIANLGLQTVLWSVDSQDYVTTKTTQEVVRNVLRKVKPGAIILFHDAGPQTEKTIGALPIILKNLSDRGYQFLPLSRHNYPAESGSRLS